MAALIKKKSKLFVQITLRFFLLTLMIILVFWLAAGSNQMRLIAENASLQAQSTATEIRTKLADLAPLPDQKIIANLEQLAARLKADAAVTLQSFAIADAAGKILQGHARTGAVLSDAEVSGIARANQIRGAKSGYYYAQPDFKNAQMSLFLPFGSTDAGFTLIGTVAMTSLHGEFASLIRLALGMAGLILMIQVFFGINFYKTLIKPILEISSAVKKFGQGELVIIESSRKKEDEIEVLINSLNGMTSAITEQKEEIQKNYREIKKKGDILQFELNIAKKIQTSIMPQSLTLPNARLNVHYQPLFTVSGDYYDVFQFEDGSRGYLIADVSGHGVPAALLTIMAKVYFSSLVQKFSDPAELLTNVNLVMSQTMNTGHYLTAFYIRIYPDLRAEYCNGSHPSPLITNAQTGEITVIPVTGFYLGLLEELPYEFETGRIQLQPGDKIVLYTDGITEAMNEAGHMYGEPRLIENIQRTVSSVGSVLQEAILSDFREFSKDKALRDDVTCIVLELTAVEKSATAETAIDFYRGSEFEKALAVFKNIDGDFFSKAPSALLYFADSSFRLKAYNDALRLFLDYAAANRVHETVMFKIGVCYSRTGESTQALEWFEKAVAQNPAFIAARASLALLLVKLDRLNEALQHIDQARNIKPDDARILRVAELVRTKLRQKTEVPAGA